MVAAALMALTLSGVCMMNARALALVVATKENVAAVRVLEDRAEQIRSAKWTQITDPAYLRDTLLSNYGGTMTTSESVLGTLTETIDVFSYPLQARDASTITVTRNCSTGVVVATATGNQTMPAKSAVVIDITATWSRGNGNGVARSVMKSMVVSNNGIVKQ